MNTIGRRWFFYFFKATEESIPQWQRWKSARVRCILPNYNIGIWKKDREGWRLLSHLDVLAVFTYSGTFMLYFTMKCNQGQSQHVIAIYFILARVLANLCDLGRRRVLLSSGVLNEGFASCSNHLSSHYHEYLPLLPPLRINNQRDAKQD